MGTCNSSGIKTSKEKSVRRIYSISSIQKQNTNENSNSIHNISITKTTSAISTPKIIENTDNIKFIEQKNANTKNLKKESNQIIENTISDLPSERGNKASTIKQNIKVSTGMIVNRSTDNLKDKYQIIKKVGEGGFGTVWKVMHVKTGLIRTMKRIAKSKNEDEIEHLINEINILKKLDHPNIVKLFEFFVEPDGFYTITEFCHHGELDDLIKQKHNLNEDVAANIIYQVLSALYYCHTSGNLIHRDLRPENILIESIDKTTNYYNIKIIDFGTSKMYEQHRNDNKTEENCFYSAPEVLNNNYSDKCDIWSCGVILYYMLSGRLPFVGNNEAETIQKIKYGRIDLLQPPFNTISIEAKDLIKKSLDVNVSKRITVKNALNHKWFKNLNTQSSFSQMNNDFVESVVNNLITFHPKNKLQEIALAYLVHNFPGIEEIKNINKIFRLLNKSKTGQLTKQEMKTYLQDYLKVNSKKELTYKIDKIFDNIDNDKNGFIECEEFARAGINKKMLLDDKIIRFLFEFIDKDNSGEINLNELKDVFGFQSGTETEKCLMNIIREVDIDGNGEISFPEFKNMMSTIIN